MSLKKREVCVLNWRKGCLFPSLRNSCIFETNAPEKAIKFFLKKSEKGDLIEGGILCKYNAIDLIINRK